MNRPNAPMSQYTAIAVYWPQAVELILLICTVTHYLSSGQISVIGLNPLIDRHFQHSNRHCSSH